MTEARHKVRFQQRREPLLSNPHKGCATFQRFNGDPLNEGTRWSEEGPVSFPDPSSPLPDPLVVAGYLLLPLVLGCAGAGTGSVGLQCRR